MPGVIAFIDDLMFLSRVREAAQGAGLQVKTARTAPEAVEAARAGAGLLVVDLDSRRLPWKEALTALRADPVLARLRVVGFLSHVNADAAREARAAGVAPVLARSAFVRQLPEILALTRTIHEAGLDLPHE